MASDIESTEAFRSNVGSDLSICSGCNDSSDRGFFGGDGSVPGDGEMSLGGGRFVDSLSVLESLSVNETQELTGILCRFDKLSEHVIDCLICFRVLRFTYERLQKLCDCMTKSVFYKHKFFQEQSYLALCIAPTAFLIACCMTSARLGHIVADA